MDMYAEQILDHQKHPRNAGSLPDANAVHQEANLSCGDRLRVELAIADGVVTGVGWLGNGCAISQAGMSLLSEHVVGKRVEELLALKKADVLALLGVPVSERRLKCALLCLFTLHNALRLHVGAPPATWTDTVADPV